MRVLLLCMCSVFLLFLVNVVCGLVDDADTTTLCAACPAKKCCPPVTCTWNAEDAYCGPRFPLRHLLVVPPMLRAPAQKPTTITPSHAPTDAPTDAPTGTPTDAPTDTPIDKPTTIGPTTKPSKPTTVRPTRRPISLKPTRKPTTGKPTKPDTLIPTRKPVTPKPTKPNTLRPTRKPVMAKLTRRPTKNPNTKNLVSKPTTRKPTQKPTTQAPTETPTTENPTETPTTSIPTTLSPTTKSPSTRPTTGRPTTRSPSLRPTTFRPTTLVPSTMTPSDSPATNSPTSDSPTTRSPTLASVRPTKFPTRLPTKGPTMVATAMPSRKPTSSKPTKLPTRKPTSRPFSARPTKFPTRRASTGPTVTKPTSLSTPKPSTPGPTKKLSWAPTRPPTSAPSQYCIVPPPDKGGCSGIGSQGSLCKIYSGCLFDGTCKWRGCVISNAPVSFRPTSKPAFASPTSLPSRAPLPDKILMDCNQPTEGCVSLTTSENCTSFHVCQWNLTSCNAGPCTPETAAPFTFRPSSARPTTNVPSVSPTLFARTRGPTSSTATPTITPTKLPMPFLCATPEGGCPSLMDQSSCEQFHGCFFAKSLCALKSVCTGSKDFRCASRGVALQAAGNILPGCVRGDAEICDEQRRHVHESFALADCGYPDVVPAALGGATLRTDNLEQELNDEVNNDFQRDYFVHPTLGVDSEARVGFDRSAPLRTLEYALNRTRRYRYGIKRRIMLMGPATHRLSKTVRLGPQDYLLTLEGENGAILSGSKSLEDLTWTSVIVPMSSTPVLKAALTAQQTQNLDKLSTLFINDEPAIRARAPNLAEYTEKKYYDSSRLSNWKRKTRITPPLTNRINVLIEPDFIDFNSYTQATGGECQDVFDPPTGFFCEPNHRAQGGCPFSLPGSVMLDATLAGTLNAKNWNMEGVYMHTFHHLYWGLWTFELGRFSSNAPTTYTPSTSPTPPTTMTPTMPTQRPTTRRPTTRRPTNRPTTRQPTTRSPSNRPTTYVPSTSPTKSPSDSPTLQPSNFPSRSPTKAPTSKSPTRSPSKRPTSKSPTQSPTKKPTSKSPTASPTKAPTSKSPTRSPSRRPTSKSPTASPTKAPTSKSPSLSPTVHPSVAPTLAPTLSPTRAPTFAPTNSPSINPTIAPTAVPTGLPTSMPSKVPTNVPTWQPTWTPTLMPSVLPTVLPTTMPSGRPTTTRPTFQMPTTLSPTMPTLRPSTMSPSNRATPNPTLVPSTNSPSLLPTRWPSGVPSVSPTRGPTNGPTLSPTFAPSLRPSLFPTREPTNQPTLNPTRIPSRSPTSTASRVPTLAPSRFPSRSPSSRPTRRPSTSPSIAPTGLPSNVPTLRPSARPSAVPTSTPSKSPSLRPSWRPSNSPTHVPSNGPTTMSPSQSPTRPTFKPTARPTALPSLIPTRAPSFDPTAQPTRVPTNAPSSDPTQGPTKAPSSFPTDAPSTKTPSSSPVVVNGRRRRQMQSSFPFTLFLNRGGFQEARGDCGEGGGDFFFENSLHLLDATNEFFLELNPDGTSSLYFFPNKTDPRTPGTKVELTSLRRLIEVVGSRDLPVTDVNIKNIQFEKTYATHMDAHEIPSGGDWSVHRGGAVFVEYVERSNFYGNQFFYMGGNGIFVSRNARDLTIQRNHFNVTGSSAILLVGDPLFDSPTPFDRTRDSDFIERVIVSENMAHHIGIVVKQSAGVFLAITKSIVLERNTIFDCARAGIIINDGFGGNTTIAHNIVFNTVMETLDHGPFNVWDRQRWWQPTDSNPSVKGFTLRSNLFFGTAGGYKGIDLDDGVIYYDVFSNVVLDSLQKFKGNAINVQGNFISPNYQACVLMTPQNKEPAEMIWANNICLSRGFSPFYYNSIDTASVKLCKRTNFIADNNTYIGGSITAGWIGCAESMTWTKWRLNYKQDTTSTISTVIPPATTMAQWMLDRLPAFR